MNKIEKADDQHTVNSLEVDVHHMLPVLGQNTKKKDEMLLAFRLAKYLCKKILFLYKHILTYV